MFDTLARICEALGLDPLRDGLQLLPASALVPVAPAPPATPDERAWSEMQGVGAYTPPLVPFPLVPSRPALLAELAAADADAVRMALLTRYPADHTATLVQANGQLHETRVGALTDQLLDGAAYLHLPSLAPLADLRGDAPLAVVARLLGPRGCPWDREQTHRSLRRELLEEAHEVLEALDADDPQALSEELGDLLLQVLMHSEMARQAGEFSLGDVHEHIAAKLIRRHPHVFGSITVSGTSEVLHNWEAIKQAERAAKGHGPRGLLDGIADGLPALAAAQKMVTKAAKAGFDADSIDYAWRKLHEELDELRASAESEPHTDEVARHRRIEEELGDLLLAITKLAHWLGMDAESALRLAHAKFRRRFAHVEQQVQAHGHDLRDLSIADKEALWRQAKDAHHEDVKVTRT